MKVERERERVTVEVKRTQDMFDTHTYTQAHKTYSSTVLQAQIHISQAMTLFGFCCSSPSLHFALHLFAVAILFLDLFFVDFLSVFFHSFFSLFALLLWFVVGFCVVALLLHSLLYSYLRVLLLSLCVSFSDVALLLLLLLFPLIFFTTSCWFEVCVHVCLYVCMCVQYCIYLYLFQFKCIYGRKYILNVLLLHNKPILEELSQAICCITM